METQTPHAGYRRLGQLVTATVVAPRTIRAKLIRILAVSLAILLALLGLSATRQVGDYENAGTTAADARLFDALQGFIHEHQKERGLTTGYVGGVREFRDRMLAQRKLTDAARGAVDRELTGRHDSAAGAVRAALVRVDALRDIRAAADRGSGQVERTYSYFTDTDVALNGLGAGLVDVRDGELRSDYQALQVLGSAKEFTGQERAVVLGSLHARRFHGEDYTRFMTARSGRLAALDSYPAWASAKQRREVTEALATPAARRLFGYEKEIVDGRGAMPAPAAVPPTAWYDAATGTINGLRTVQIALGEDIKDRASALQDEATRTLVLFGLLALGSVLALGALAVGAARSVSGPLGSLTRQAREVAGRRLPDAVAQVQSGSGTPAPLGPLTVPRGAGSEVQQLADAFDQMQKVAYDLATEQAVLRRNATESLVSLGRRNQNLVRRQISFINRLEHEDADPETLANLFELDHLATRMRRNAESLLVLAGEASPRTSATPLSVTDVIRAALSEVEEYRRVTLRRVDPGFLSGAVVSEVAHLLAELVENALSFSPPETEVEVEGRRTSAGYLIAIVDHGTGMTAPAMAEANVRLSGMAGFMAEPTRFLGHFVVGALARRCGIEVRLGEAPAAGTVARVLIPGSLLTEPSAVAADVDVPGTRGEQAAEPERKRPAAGPRADDAAERHDAAGPPAEPRTAAGPAADDRAGEALPHPRAARESEATTPATTPAEARGAAASRTRNGLVKRARRSAIQSAVNEAAAPRWQQQAAPTPDRTPDEVSGMLATLRSAHMRGGISVEKEREKEQATGAAEAGQGSGQDTRPETARTAKKGDEK
ncbi:nitrate- and nitrite sensing domain-containing protein [Streptomyces auratus AGR0001]|uniref:histidine kinase n=1 Tax=Streptomyces auratus AGR0001 TaxID=1160718 RepID=A0A8B1NU50_9ACTN|nr:nitrate- and nitrite sensing domain-containing protein [Streptomyces auratus AGR0001]